MTTTTTTRPDPTTTASPRSPTPPATQAGAGGGPVVHPQPLPAGASVRHRTRGRVRDLVTGTLGRPRFVSQRPPALLEHIAYARTGEWAVERDGPRRSLALVYAWLVAIPLATAGYLVAWVAARPGRFATAVVVTSTVVAAVSAIVRMWGWSR
jgi:hypothetical protein